MVPVSALDHTRVVIERNCDRASKVKIEHTYTQTQEAAIERVYDRVRDPQSSALHISRKAGVALAAISNSLALWVSICIYVRSIVLFAIDLTHGYA
jgi:hypothetical protein